MPTPLLFQPISFRSVTARNRIVVSPMCQYSANDGLGSDWHVQHLGARAAGGAGIVFTEATHVSAIGRITHGCLGLYTAEHQALLTRLANVITLCGSVPGIQIAHAGRKASSHVPWEGGKPIPVEDGGWVPVAPSALPSVPGATVPHALSASEIGDIIGQFAATARMAREAGFKVLEIHGAHGYLGHSFLSPISNQRNDSYGGDLNGRVALPDGDHRGDPRRMAVRPAAMGAPVLHRLDAGRPDHRGYRRRRPQARRDRDGRPDRLLIRRRVARAEDPVAASRLSGSVRRRDPQPGRHRHRRGRA